MMMRMKKETNCDDWPHRSEIHQLILIDRECDYITPVCTQLTYEGLVDEYFGIINGFVEVDPEIIGKDAPPGKKMNIPLNSNDKLYSQIRDLNFSVILPILNRKAKEITEIYNQRQSQVSVSQLRDYVRRFGQAQKEHQSLSIRMFFFL
jgi:hypothetical protein